MHYDNSMLSCSGNTAGEPDYWVWPWYPQRHYYVYCNYYMTCMGCGGYIWNAYNYKYCPYCGTQLYVDDSTNEKIDKLLVKLDEIKREIEQLKT